MIKVDHKVAQAIYNLTRSGKDFDTFVVWLKDSLTDELYRGAIAGQEPQRSWGQGRSQQLIEILGNIEGADRNLDAFKGKH